jgi:vanillate O-demethylase monooxygenase subunit
MQDASLLSEFPGFPRNYWFVAGWDHEIISQPVARTLCGERVVLYRKPDRSVVALEDCCPHRMLPLSKGFCSGDNIVCGYHGLELGPDGCGVRMPNHGKMSDKARVKAYPVVERHRFVWVWIGDPERADPELVPDLWYCSDKAWAFEGGVYDVACDYRLLVDNLMDLTHETFVHPTSIGQEEITEVPIATSHDDTARSVTVTRWMLDIDPPPFWSHNLRSKERCDRWQICNFTLPANVMIDVGVALAGTGAPEGDRSKGVTGIVVDLMTPVTETTCRYYWGMARDFEINDLGLSLRIKEAQGKVFAEDSVVLEAQQANILAHPGKELVSFKIDAGAARSRLLINQHLDRLS